MSRSPQPLFGLGCHTSPCTKHSRGHWKQAREILGQCETERGTIHLRSYLRFNLEEGLPEAIKFPGGLVPYPRAGLRADPI
jgi:hypothetical protein